MNRTKIEWVKNPDGSQGYTWNPITGCLNGCPYCYARKLANGRLKQRYLANTEVADPIHYGSIIRSAHYPFDDPFYPRFWPERLLVKELGNPFDPSYARMKPKGIFVCDMGELFGDWIPEQWQASIFTTIASHPYDRFYLLTKQPQNLIKFLGGNITNTHQGYRKPQPLPDNCWAGITVTNRQQAYGAKDFLREVKATVKFLSLEPLLEKMDGDALENVITRANLIILGACTGTLDELKNLNRSLYGGWTGLQIQRYGTRHVLSPQIEWVKEIVESADKAGIPVFLKDNLKPLMAKLNIPDLACYADLWRKEDHIIYAKELRQEMPK